MAEAIARDRLGPGAGVVFESAGLYALDEAPATPHAVEAAEELGADLSTHRARSLTRAMVEEADRIYVMTRSQAEALGHMGADLGGKMDLARARWARTSPTPTGGMLRPIATPATALPRRWKPGVEEWRAAGGGRASIARAAVPSYGVQPAVSGSSTACSEARISSCSTTATRSLTSNEAVTAAAPSTNTAKAYTRGGLPAQAGAGRTR